MKDLIGAASNFFSIILSEKWKALAAFFFVILLVVSAVFWFERDTIINALFSEGPVLNTKFIEEKAEYYRNNARANVLILWKTDFARNQRSVIVFDTKNFGRINQLEGLNATIFTKVSEENEFFLRMLNGETVCGTLIPTSTVGQVLYGHSITYLCRSPISGNDGIILGYITFGYLAAPKNPEEEFLTIEYIRSVSKEVAKQSNNIDGNRPITGLFPLYHRIITYQNAFFVRMTNH